MDFLPNLQSALGLIAFPVIALLFSKGPKKLNFRLLFVAVGLQIVLALTFLKVPFFQNIFKLLNEAVLALQAATNSGTSFLFGYIGGGPAPFDVGSQAASCHAQCMCGWLLVSHTQMLPSLQPPTAMRPNVAAQGGDCDCDCCNVDACERPTACRSQHTRELGHMSTAPGDAQFSVASRLQSATTDSQFNPRNCELVVV